jgi:hypothetical protein
MATTIAPGFGGYAALSDPGAGSTAPLLGAADGVGADAVVVADVGGLVDADGTASVPQAGTTTSAIVAASSAARGRRERRPKGGVKRIGSVSEDWL